MNKASEWKVPKWPFLLSDVILIVIAYWLVSRARHPISSAEVLLVIATVALGAVCGCLPFIMDYNATAKLIEVNALGEVAEKIQDLKQFTSQVSSTTDQWARVQEATQGQAEKTAAAAREIVDRITAEVQDFAKFQKKMNDAEKSALRLEVEKLRRIEGDWLQVVVRILDHIFALHTAAARSGQPEVAGEIAQFQIACRDAARRVGLIPFVAEPGEPFDAERHRAHGVETPPDDAVTDETLAPGLTFQGRLIRPVLVRLRGNGKKENTSPSEIKTPAAIAPTADPEKSAAEHAAGELI